MATCALTGRAPGVGRLSMLAEAHRRMERGTDVVAAVIETHGRRKTSQLLAGIEVIPPQLIEYQGDHYPELDLDAVLARRPRVVLIDDLAHVNTPGSKNANRWQDIEHFLNAGITVITTVNVQHLESLNDVVTQITGVEQQERIPDEIVRSADQIELVDITPEALRRRLVHGNVYPPNYAEAALSNYFRPGYQMHSGNWRCYGWPTRLRPRWPNTAPTRTSPTLGRPRAGGRGRHRRRRVRDAGAQGVADRVEVPRRTQGRPRHPGRRADQHLVATEERDSRARSQPGRDAAHRRRRRRGHHAA